MHSEDDLKFRDSESLLDQFLVHSSEELRFLVQNSFGRSISTSHRPLADRSSTCVVKVAEGVYLKASLFSAESALGDQILKSDVFPGLHLLPYPNPVKGCSNLRRVENPRVPVFGVSQPTIAGIEGVIKYILEEETSVASGIRNIVWVNLREEPLIYIHGRSYSCREPSTLDENLDYLFGIASETLHDLEERLRADVIKDAQLKGGVVEYLVQGKRMENEICNRNAEFKDIQTVRSVYDSIVSKGYSVNYNRVPITDECAPDDDDFTRLVNIFKDGHNNSAFVFNCQMGKGRTTTVMVCAYLYFYMHAIHHKDQDLIFAHQKHRERLLVTYKGNTPQNEEYSSLLRNGMFKSVKDWLRVQFGQNIELGYKLKQIVDESIDACCSVQNIREGIFECKLNAERAIESSKGEHNADFYIKKGLNYLERYIRLLIFAQYLKEQIPSRFRITFSKWIKNRWAYQRILRNLSLV